LQESEELDRVAGEPGGGHVKTWRVSCTNFIARQSYGGVVLIADDVELIADLGAEFPLVSFVCPLLLADSAAKVVAR
jgi:hypothetical protein